MTDKPTIKILQYNVARKRPVMADLFANKEINDIDIIAVQEPWRNFDTLTIPQLDKERFELVYPSQYPQARVCFFINKRAELSSWKYKFHTGDLATVTVKTTDGRKIRIHNIYNQKLDDDQQPTLERLSEVLEGPTSGNEVIQDEQMIVGDFNLHHPAWGGVNSITDKKSSELLDITESLSMDQLLPRGTATYTENCSTTIDLVFATPGVTNSLIHCNVATELDAHSDHQPILTTIHAQLKRSRPAQIRLWRKTNPAVLQSSIIKSINTNPQLSAILYAQSVLMLSRDQLDKAVQDLFAIIDKAAKAATPIANITPRSKPGFDEECKEAQMICRRLKKRRMKLLTNEAWEDYRLARNYKNHLITKKSNAAYRTFIAQACESPDTMWKKTKWSRDPTPSQTCLP